MKHALLAIAVMTCLMTAFTTQSNASTFAVAFSGPGVSGDLFLTYGAATDSKYPAAYEITSISGTFTDTNNGLQIENVPVGPLVSITHDTPETTNLLAPNDFSKFAVASGLPPESNGFVTYDNLFWPNGSPQTASDYPPHGGFLDIYGVMFNIGGGDVVDFWSNGTGTNGLADYGIAVANSNQALDYVGSGVSVPEPGSLWLFTAALLGLFHRRRKVQRTL